jgi:hypothetical protein
MDIPFIVEYPPQGSVTLDDLVNQDTIAFGCGCLGMAEFVGDIIKRIVAVVLRIIITITVAIEEGCEIVALSLTGVPMCRPFSNSTWDLIVGITGLSSQYAMKSSTCEG